MDPRCSDGVEEVLKNWKYSLLNEVQTSTFFYSTYPLVPRYPTGRTEAILKEHLALWPCERHYLPTPCPDLQLGIRQHFVSLDMS